MHLQHCSFSEYFTFACKDQEPLLQGLIQDLAGGCGELLCSYPQPPCTQWCRETILQESLGTFLKFPNHVRTPYFPSMLKSTSSSLSPLPLPPPHLQLMLSPLS